MKISSILLALCAVTIAGCSSNSGNATSDATSNGTSDVAANAPSEMDGNSANAPAMPKATTDSMSGNSMSGDAMSGSGATTNAASAATMGDKYRVRGQVTEVMPAGADGEASLMVKHENIPDFMEAMTMRFPLANAADASKVKAGDKIVFDVKKGNTEVSNIEMLPPSTELKLAP